MVINVASIAIRQPFPEASVFSISELTINIPAIAIMGTIMNTRKYISLYVSNRNVISGRVSFNRLKLAIINT